MATWKPRRELQILFYVLLGFAISMLVWVFVGMIGMEKPSLARTVDILGGILVSVLALVVGMLAVRSDDVIKAVKKTKSVSPSEARHLASAEGLRVSVYGKVRSDTWLQGPSSSIHCVYYRYMVERWIYMYRASHWDTLRDERRYILFDLADSSGSIRVNLDGASIWKPDLAGPFLIEPDGTETPGREGIRGSLVPSGQLKSSEWVIPVGSMVTAIGDAVLGKDGPQLVTGGRPLIVTPRPTSELLHSFRLRSRLTMLASAVMFAIGGFSVFYCLTHPIDPALKTAPGIFKLLLVPAVLALVFGLALVIVSLRGQYDVTKDEPSITGRPATDLTRTEPGLSSVMEGLVMADLAHASAAPASAPEGLPMPLRAARSSRQLAEAMTARSDDPAKGMAVIQHDIVIGGALAFKEGEMVRVEGENPDPQRPEYKHIVLSAPLNKRFRLSDRDLYA